ncbi:Spheroplast protein Y precursor [Marinomonas spartinae]|uniref:Spy/CpxP family protein refolding chaperone n=1 Tax=Marinomonas spartinae TaxID=1792290 RepID=UPI000808FB34|nr:Spy/CpxP family protein refolding chaperone [Marinomonas spartinae]SBS32886.1 Spheroplast protein Y precursor [Marinomonas spartinae]
MIKLTKKLILTTVALPFILTSVSVLAEGEGPVAPSPDTAQSPSPVPPDAAPSAPNAASPSPVSPGVVSPRLEPSKHGPKPPSMGVCRPGMGPDRLIAFAPHMMRELHLSEAQREKLKALRRADMKEMRAAEIAHEKRLNRLLNADKFNKVAARKVVTEMDNARISHQVATLERQYKILHILTPQQKAEYMKLKREQRHQCEEKMHHRLVKEHRKPVY